MRHGPRRRASSLFSRAALVLSVTAALTLPAGASFAQSDEEKAAARALATQGADALKNNKFADALDLVSRAQAIVHAPTHLLMIARAQTGLGKLVAAQETYLKLLREDLAPNAPQAFKNAQATAKDELAAIEGKIGGLRLSVDGAAQKKATIKIDDQPMPPALLGVFRPIDPGVHIVMVYPPGQAVVKGSVDIGPGEKKELHLAIPDGPISGVPANPTDNPDATRPVDTGTPRDTGGGGFMTPLRGAGIGIGAAGLVGVVVGAVFVAKGFSTQSQANTDFNTLCPMGICKGTMAQMVAAQNQVNSEDSSAASQKTVGTAILAVGGAALVTGVVLIVVGKPKPGAAAPAAATVTPWFTGTAGGLLGTF
jgi:hypothetical protein